MSTPAPPPARAYPPRPPKKPRRRLSRRQKQVLALVAALGLLVLAALLVRGIRPVAIAADVAEVPDAQVGTTYAFDGSVCLEAVGGATVRGVEVRDAPGGRTELRLAPPDERPTVAFPLAEVTGEPLEGYEVPAGELDCELRVLVTPTSTGDVLAGEVRVSLSYGPLGLLRRTAVVVPRVLLDVTGSGTDPRLEVAPS